MTSNQKPGDNPMEDSHAVSSSFDDTAFSTAERCLLSALDHQVDAMPNEALAQLRYHRTALLSGDTATTTGRFEAMSRMRLVGFAGSACTVVAMSILMIFTSPAVLQEPFVTQGLAVESVSDAPASDVSELQETAFDTLILLSDIESEDWELVENVEFAWWLSEVETEWERSDYAG